MHTFLSPPSYIYRFSYDFTRSPRVLVLDNVQVLDNGQVLDDGQVPGLLPQSFQDCGSWIWILGLCDVIQLLALVDDNKLLWMPTRSRVLLCAFSKAFLMMFS